MLKSRLAALGSPRLVRSLEQQHRIGGVLDAMQAQMDALKHLQAETATDLEALMPAILDQVFKGEFLKAGTSNSIRPCSEFPALIQIWVVWLTRRQR